MNLKKDPVFIVGNVKSGTTLLQSLLDFHPQLFVIPIELKIFKFLALPSMPPGNMPPPPLDSWHCPIPRQNIGIDQIKKELLGHSDFKQLLSLKFTNRGISIPPESFNVDLFQKIIYETNVATYKELYTLIFWAFCNSFPNIKDSVKENDFMFVEKTPSLEEYAQELKEWFPNAKFIHVLRNPYANAHSMQKGSVLTRDLRKQIYRQMMKSLYFMERNNKYIDDYLIVRYEDIVLKTDKTLHQIANFINIEFDKSLTRPTFLGDKWGGNSRTSEDDFEGIDPSPVDAFLNNIAPLHISVVNRYFEYILDKYKYKRLPSPGIMNWLPVGLEHPANYVSNRKLLSDSII